MVGVGSALPARCVTNAELAETVDTSDEWIVARTGIRSRYIASEGETTATLATEAARRALAHAGIDAADVGLIVLATATPDQTFPASATRVQAALGIDDCIAFDVAAVCSGFLYALSVADSMMRGGAAKVGLVIGAETFSRILDWEDRGTCVLFGDGAGLSCSRPRKLAGDDSKRGVLATVFTRTAAQRPALRRRRPVHYRYRGQASHEGTRGVSSRRDQPQCRADRNAHAANLTIDDVDWVVPHQANARILDATARSWASRREGSRDRGQARQHVGVHPYRWRSISPFATGASSRAIWCSSKRWAAVYTWAAAAVRY
jgi:3-oxoacyl-[acyl-carrier-protein] synthase-3